MYSTMVSKTKLIDRPHSVNHTHTLLVLSTYLMRPSALALALSTFHNEKKRKKKRKGKKEKQIKTTSYFT